jgi:Ca2+-binding RTX toxin-like protein
MRASWVLTALTLALAAVPSPASGAAASVSRATLTYEAGPGEANRVTVVRAPNAFRIVDAGAFVVPGAGCASTAPNAVDCRSRGISNILVHANDGDDVVTTSVTTATTVAGAAGDDRLEGGEGADDLRGGSGDDVREGGDSSDVLDGGPGADRLSGGVETAGIFEFDAVVYATRTAAVRVSLDGAADDGEPGEGDNVLRDVELVVGGRGDDVLVGNGRTLNGFLGGRGDDLIVAGGGQIDALFGEHGDDVLLGGAGTDGMFGGGADDLLVGGGGDDFMQGGNGDDRLRGGRGGDGILAGRGRDAIAGGPGNDELHARDGMRDAVAGGAGRDTARVDAADVVSGVETIRLPARVVRGSGAALTGRGAAPSLDARRAAVRRWIERAGGR